MSDYPYIQEVITTATWSLVKPDGTILAGPGLSYDEAYEGGVAADETVMVLVDNRPDLPDQPFLVFVRSTDGNLDGVCAYQDLDAS